MNNELTDEQIPNLRPTGPIIHDMEADMWWPMSTREDEITMARAAIAADRALRQAEQEPDGYQQRYVFPGEKPGEWLVCSKETAEALRARRNYEVRKLYAAPTLCVPKTPESETQTDLSLTGATQAKQKPVARLEGIDEYGPRLEWFSHWVNLPVGSKLYAAPQPAHVQPLTDEQIVGVRKLNELETISIEAFRCVVRAIEAAYGTHPARSLSSII